MQTSSAECWSCRSNSGERRISPGQTIHLGEFWQVEHAYPTRLPGWLVIVLRRHAEALHELKPEEFAEFATVLEHTCRLLHEVLHCEKEYVACYAEMDHFRHVHFHVVPRAKDLPREFAGTKSFALLQVSESDALPREQIEALSVRLSAAYALAYPIGYAQIRERR